MLDSLFNPFEKIKKLTLATSQYWRFSPSPLGQRVVEFNGGSMNWLCLNGVKDYKTLDATTQYNSLHLFKT